jgi:hypothetical protein
MFLTEKTGIEGVNLKNWLTKGQEVAENKLYWFLPFGRYLLPTVAILPFG